MAKFEIKKFNGSNFLFWKLKMKAILRKDNCLTVISEWPTDITNDNKWNDIDRNSITNLHLGLAGGIFLITEEKNKIAKEIWDHLIKLYEAKSLHNKIFLKYFWDVKIYFSDIAHKYFEYFIFLNL